MTWTTDPLGAGFYQRFIELHDDDYGPNRAALVTYRPDWLSDDTADETLSEPVTSHEPGAPSFALLAVHGWNDYFYHYEFARRVAEMGGQFYALDLRKYGRAHMDGQMWGYVEDLSMYDEEIGKALDVIYDAHGLDVPLFLYGHSTGGLTVTLWADRHPGVLRGLILNSPWLELQASSAARQLSQPILDAVNRMAPTAILPSIDNGFYQRLLTGWMSEEEREQAKKMQEDAGMSDEEVDPFVRDGGWNPNPDFRQFPSFPIRPGWLGAILHGQERVADGLAIQCPVLVMTSGKTYYSDTWSEEMRNSDTVLDVEQIWKRVPGLGAVTTLVKLEGAIHDVLLSRASVRDAAYWHIATFTDMWASPADVPVLPINREAQPRRQHHRHTTHIPHGR